MKIEFDGTISPDLEDDIRKVYFFENPFVFMPLFALVFISAAFALAIDLGIDPFESVRHMNVVRELHTHSIFNRIAIWAPVPICFYLSVLRPYHWWSFWWKGCRGLKSTGAIVDLGVWIPVSEDEGTLIPWNRFEEARISDAAVFLPLGRADGLAFHRTFFRDDADWTSFIEVLRSSKLRNRLLKSSSADELASAGRPK